MEKVSNDQQEKKKPTAKKTKDSFKAVAWVGTSISNVLDREKFEKDTNVKLKSFKAYGITDEKETPYPKEKFRFPLKNFKNVVPEVVENEDVDALIMHTGSIEITNIKVNEALMDSTKDIEDYKREWFHQVEEDSKNVFSIAEEAIKKKPDLKVIILKRLPRFDRSSQDLIGIKSQLSTFANSAYDHLWVKLGSPKNIQVVEANMQTQSSQFLRNLIYGSRNAESVDGIHLRGSGGSRHFTYRVIQAVKPVLASRQPANHSSWSKESKGRNSPANHSSWTMESKSRKSDNHTDCPQASYQKKSAKRINSANYAEAVKGKHYVYTVPTSNIYNHLN